MISRRIRIAQGVLAITAVTAVTVLSGCSGSQPSDGASGGGQRTEIQSVDIALTGVGAISNVPLYLAQQLGYFHDEGIDVKLTALKGGSDAIQSLITNTVDATTNEYIHTIAAQQQSKAVESVAVFEDAPTYAMVVTKDHKNATVKDLAGLRIGVVSLGGSTEDLVNYLFETNGLDPAKAKLVSVGAGSTQSAAIQSGAVGALIATEPTLTTALKSGAAKILVDLRKPSVIKEMFGGPAPFWSLLVTKDFAKKNPKTTQALTSACVRALAYMHSHSAEEIAANVPADVFFPSGDKTTFLGILQGGLEGFSKDGLMPSGGPSNIKKYLETAQPKTDLSSIDLSQTYDDRFAKHAAEQNK